jgi:hypothetical protein
VPANQKDNVMTKDPKRKLPLSAMPDSRTDEETIRKRAYELYVDRGMEDGHDLEDWCRAEEELLGQERAVAA